MWRLHQKSSCQFRVAWRVARTAGCGVAYLGNRNAGSRRLTDLTDLAAGPPDDAANHICGDADVLSLDLLAILIVCRGTAAGCVRIRSAAEWSNTTIAEVGSVAGAHNPRTTVVASAATVVVVASQATGAGLRAHNGVVEDSAGTTLPVVDKALANLPHSSLNAVGSALDLDNSFRGLG